MRDRSFILMPILGVCFLLLGWFNATAAGADSMARKIEFQGNSNALVAPKGDKLNLRSTSLKKTKITLTTILDRLRQDASRKRSVVLDETSSGIVSGEDVSMNIQGVLGKNSETHMGQ